MTVQLIHGDCLDVLKTLDAGSVQTCVTSPPYYGLRDYGHDGQIGLEESPDAYVAKLVDVFREVRRVLHPTGTCWINLGDSYAGSGRGLMGDGTPSDRGDAKQGTNRGATVGQFNRPDWGVKPKDLIGIPWLVAFALRADGWWLRSDIIWHKINCMPESVRDRPTKAHEYIFLLSKSASYFYDADAVREEATTDLENKILPRGSQGYAAASAGIKSNAQRGHINGYGYVARGYRNRRSVWTVTTKPYSGAHFATFPPDLIEPCILAGSKRGDTVLDPFNGSGTTGAVALKHGRHYIGIELNPDYIELAHERIRKSQPLLLEAI